MAFGAIAPTSQQQAFSYLIDYCIAAGYTPASALGEQGVVAAIVASFLQDGYVSVSGGLGYATGAGGAITQATNRTTGVTLNKICGAITTNNASLAAEATAVFVVTNSFVAATDVVVLSQKSGSNGGGTVVEVVAVAAGSFSIAVQNNNVAAGTAETGAIIINFAVIKAVAA